MLIITACRLLQRGRAGKCPRDTFVKMSGIVSKKKDIFGQMMNDEVKFYMSILIIVEQV